MNRAEARIDTGVARLTNRWMERRWATYTGATTELHLTGVDGDALTRKSPEFHIDCGERAIAVSDCTDLAWSEAVDQHGASLSLAMRSPGLFIRLETFIAHQSPGMVRQLQLFNTSHAALTITRVAAEILPLDPDTFSPNGITENRTRDLAGRAGETRYLAHVTAPAGALLLGTNQPDGFALFAPNPRYCASVWTGYEEIAPGKAWTPPPTTLTWQAGATPTDIDTEAVAGLQEHWREHCNRS